MNPKDAIDQILTPETHDIDPHINVEDDGNNSPMNHSPSIIQQDEEEEESDYDIDETMHDWATDDDAVEPYQNNNGSCGPFESNFACYSLSKTDKLHLEQGNQIIMPESAFEKLISLQVDFPVLFKIRNDSKGRVSHCGVYEFTADEGTALLPSWMMKNLQLEEGEIISLESANLQKGTYIKIQPHSVDFLGIRNPKAALEECFGNKFFCLTVGDTILINYNGKDFFINILDAKPSSSVCILNTDCEVDFAAPLDYKEPVKPVKPAESDQEVKSSGFVPFSGTARRLDGKPAAETSIASKSQTVGVNRMSTESEKSQAKSLFGPSQVSKKLPMESATTETPQKKEFQPFTGKKYTLSG